MRNGIVPSLVSLYFSLQNHYQINMLAERTKNISPFIVMEVLEKAAEMERQGIDVVHLEVGEPDFAVPGCISNAIQKAFEKGKTHYTHSLGEQELREEISKRYLNEYNAEVSPDQIIVTSGSSPAILLSSFIASS